jgi:hypothetical protein
VKLDVEVVMTAAEADLFNAIKAQNKSALASYVFGLSLQMRGMDGRQYVSDIEYWCLKHDCPVKSCHPHVPS